jgi:hypothetical protein
MLQLLDCVLFEHYKKHRCWVQCECERGSK